MDWPEEPIERAHKETCRAAMDSEEVMGFGKHADLTFEQVRTRHPDYLQWARRKRDEEGVDAQVRGRSQRSLSRFR